MAYVSEGPETLSRGSDRSLLPAPGLQPPEDTEGQLSLSVLRTRFGRHGLQPGRRPAGRAPRPRLVSGAPAAGQEEFEGQRVRTDRYGSWLENRSGRLRTSQFNLQ